MEEHFPSFPADLTREEYIAYHMLSARTVGPLRGRKVQLIATGIMCFLLLAAVLYGWTAFGEMDWLTLGLTVALAAVSVLLWVLIPRRFRRQAERYYEEQQAVGYRYYGTIEVRPTEIVKVGEELTTVIPLNANALFIENTDMLVWISRQGRAIVLPARCMTQESAAAVRAAADRLPAQNRRFIGRLQPLGQVPTEPPAVPDPVVWEKQVLYTPAEYAALAKSRVLSQYWRRLPMLATFSLLVAVMFGWSDTSALPGMLFFLATLAVQTVFHLVLPYTRVPRDPQSLPERMRTVQVTFTQRGVKLRDGDNFAAVPWSAVDHVYDRGDYAEVIYHRQGLRIPKREIEDLEAFNGLLHQYWRNK